MEGKALVKKTFCDRCGSQCINTTVNITIVVVHHTKDLQYVGADEHKPIEVCLNCTDELRTLFPQAFILTPKDEMMMAEAPVRDMGTYVNERAEVRADRMPR